MSLALARLAPCQAASWMRVQLRNRHLALILTGWVTIGAGGLAAQRAGAQPFPDSVTVSLVEGWNLVGWTGDETPILAATADIAYQFDELRTFDPKSGAMLRFRDGIPPDQNSLTELRYGTGVWVRMGQEGTWTHEPRAPSTTVALEPGFNLVAWLGEDDTPISVALAPLGAAVLSAYTWDRAGQRFRQHLATGETAFLNESADLMRGDALWVEMAAAADWAQALPGADAVTAVVDAFGANLDHADGASVDVPPGALPAGTPISLFRTETPPNLPGHVNWVGQTYEVSAGAALDDLATLRVPVPSGVDPAELDLFRLGASNQPIAQGAALEDGRLVARTVSFSKLSVGTGLDRVPIVGPTLVKDGATIQYLIGDSALADVEMTAEWEFKNDLVSDIFDQSGATVFSRKILVTFKNGATGSGTIRVKVSTPDFTAAGQLAVQTTTVGPTVAIEPRDADSGRVGDSIVFLIQGFGGTPPYDFEIDFDEGDDPVDCMDCDSVVELSNKYETPGLKTVLVTVTDANLQFARGRTSVSISPRLSCSITAPSELTLGFDTFLELTISGGEPTYAVEWLVTSFHTVVNTPPDPQIWRVDGKGGDVVWKYTWSPPESGTYRLVVVVSDALGTECRRSFDIRVPPLGISLDDPPVGVQKGVPFTIAGKVSGALSVCSVGVIADDGKLLTAIRLDSQEFELADDAIRLDTPGTHELTIGVVCGAARVSVKHLIQVLDGEAGWVRGFPIANHGNGPLLVSADSGSYQHCRINLPDEIAYTYITKFRGVEKPTADLEFAFGFDPPPLQVVPGTEVDLNLSGEVTGSHSGARNSKLRLAYSGTLVISSQEAVVELDGIDLSASRPLDVVADAATATAEFPAVGGDTGFIDVSVGFGVSGCRIRWSYVRVPPSNRRAVP